VDERAGKTFRCAALGESTRRTTRTVVAKRGTDKERVRKRPTQAPTLTVTLVATHERIDSEAAESTTAVV